MSDFPQHIVIIARHYPPIISGGGRRVVLWVKTLRERGIRVSVVAPILPKGEDGIPVPHPQPEPDLTRSNEGKTRLKDTFRTWLFYPDNDVKWCRRAAKAIETTWPQGIDWVITTSPPESVHVAGHALKCRLNCHWHADIRDYWLEHPLIKIRRNPLRKWIETKIAKKLFSKADLITAVSDGMANEAQKLSNKKVAVLENFADAPPKRSSHFFDEYPAKTVHVVYTGAFEISDPQRKLNPILEVFSNACEHNPNLFLHILGPLLTREASELEASKAGKRSKYYGKVPIEKALLYQVNADALLITAAVDSVIVPGKLAEYQMTGLPIIAIGDGAWTDFIKGETDSLQQLINLKKIETAKHTSLVMTAKVATERLLKLMRHAQH